MNADWSSTITRYQAALRAGDYPAGTIYLRGYHLRRLARETDKPPSALNRNDLIAFLDHPQWSPAYRRSFRVTFRAFFRWAREEHLIAHNPMKGIKTASAPIGKPRPAPEEAVQQGQTYSDRRVPTMVRLAAWAGLRCCEICQVHRDDVSRAPSGYRLRVHGKGRKIRVIPIPTALALEILEADGYLFEGQINGHLSAAYVSKLISRALPEQWTAHTLRHRFGTKALKGSGNNLRVVQELLGHASVATTQIYTQIEDDDMAMAVNYAAA